VSVPDNHHVVVLPVAFPLAHGHHLPAGQIWVADIGSRDFLTSLCEMATSEDGTFCSVFQWADQFTTLQVWLDVVAADPSSFCIPWIARDSIQDALVLSNPMAPSISDDSLAHLTWIQTGVNCHLH